MTDLTLSGRTPVLYYDPDDHDRDGAGYNVLYANGAFVDRFATFDQALAAFRALLAETKTRISTSEPDEATS